MALSVHAMTSIYVSVALVRAANAVFIVSLAFTLPFLSPAFHGLILASYAILEALSGILAGGLYERFGARSILSFSTLTLALSYVLMHVSLNPIVVLLLNSLAGVMAAGVLVASLSVLAEETRGRPLARLLGSGGFEASNLGGYALGFAIAFLLEVLGFLQGFLVSAMLASLAFLASLLAPSVTGRRLSIVVERNALKLAPLWFGLASLIGLAFTAPKILVETGITIPGLSGEGGVSLTLIAGLASVSVGLLVGSYIASLIGKLGALVLGSTSIPLALVIGGFFLEELLKPHLLPLIAMLAIPAMTLPPTMLALLADYTDASKARGAQMGFYVSILGAGIAFGEFALGGLTFQWLGLTATALLAAVLFAILAIPTVYLVYTDVGTRRTQASSKS